MRDKWFETYRPDLSDEDREIEEAVMRHGAEFGVFLDDVDGIVDRDGEIHQKMNSSDLMAMANDPDAFILNSNQKKMVDAIRADREERGISPETSPEEQELTDLRKNLDDIMAEPEDLNLELETDKLLSSMRENAAINKSNTLRAAVNRMARGGSSPEAMSGTQAQLAQQHDAAIAQQESIIEFQAQAQNISNKITIWQNKAQMAWNLFQLAVGVDAKREARAAAMQADANARQLQQDQFNAANKFNAGLFAAKVGIGIVGAVAGAFSGGAGAALAGGVIASLGTAGVQAATSGGGAKPTPISSGSLTAAQSTLPATKLVDPFATVSNQ